MRVLHVINSLGAGGAERSLAEMLPLFVLAGVENEVICFTRAAEGVHERVERSGVPVQVVGASRLAAVPRLRRAIMAFKPDVVHTTIYEADVLGRLAAAGTRCRVLTSLVNTTYDGVRLADTRINPLKFGTAHALDALTARHLTDHFHAISTAVKESAVTHLGVDPRVVTVVERGRDVSRLGEPSPLRRQAVRTRLELDEDAEIVVNVGRQEPQKDQSTLLRAFAQLVRSRPRLVLLQVGREGKASVALKGLVSDLRIADRVRLLGHRDDVPDLLAAADIFVFPSIYEGLGGAVLEAMAMRLPIVVTDIPALVEVVETGRGASIVPVRDPTALAGAMEWLLNDRDRAARMAEQAQQIFFERFTLGRSAHRMVALYQEVAGA